MTGEALSTEDRKWSFLSLESGPRNLQIEYFESEQVKFSVMSVGEAAGKGLWTVISPGLVSSCSPPKQTCEAPRKVQREKLPPCVSKVITHLPLRS